MGPIYTISPRCQGCHFLLALLFAGGIFAVRPQEGQRSSADRGLELWIPTGWHKDPQGHDVKDTWDHYKMPLCDSGPAVGALKKAWGVRNGALLEVYLHKKKLRKMKDLDEAGTSFPGHCWLFFPAMNVDM